jgi:hypothetical protein
MKKNSAEIVLVSGIWSFWFTKAFLYKEIEEKES